MKPPVKATFKLEIFKYAVSPETCLIDTFPATYKY